MELSQRSRRTEGPFPHFPNLPRASLLVFKFNQKSCVCLLKFESRFDKSRAAYNAA
jgi:hypothetical protein